MTTTHTQSTNFTLEYFSGSNAKEEIISGITLELIQELIKELNWQEFNHIALKKENGNWLGISGKLGKNDFICLYKEGEELFTIDEPLNSEKQINDVLIAYFKEDNAFKEKYPFTGENDTPGEKALKAWRKQFLNSQKQEKEANIKRSLGTIFTLVFISSIAYYWYIGELQFFGQATELTKAEIVNTKMHHIGNGYSMQTVKYQFEYKEILYTGTFEAGKSIGKRKVGEFVKVKFSVVNPKRSKVEGVYK